MSDLRKWEHPALTAALKAFKGRRGKPTEADPSAAVAVPDDACRESGEGDAPAQGPDRAVRFALFLPWLLAVLLTGVVLFCALQPLARSLRLLGS